MDRKNILKEGSSSGERRRKQICREEENEERELYGYCLKLEGMRESCLLGGRDIFGLIEEQQELLNTLREERHRFLASWENQEI